MIPETVHDVAGPCEPGYHRGSPTWRSCRCGEVPIPGACGRPDCHVLHDDPAHPIHPTLTEHIRRMLRVSHALAWWCQADQWDEDVDARYHEVAQRVGTAATAEFAAALARHAAAELEMERFEARDGWPGV